MRRLVPLALLALLGAACGGVPGGTTTTATPETVVGTVPTEPTVTIPAEYQNGDAAAGKAVFEAKCGVCHTLSDAGTTGTVGPNLDEAKPSLELALDRVVNGQGVMPSFKGQLSAQEIADVAAYVVKATSG